MNRIISLTVFLTSIAFCCFSQREIPVDMYTGTPIIEIPLGSVHHHDINVPITLSYRASGLRMEDTKDAYGLGWNLSVDYSVRRTLKGLPDDFSGTGSDPRRGWLYSNSASITVAADVGAFSNSADLTATTCNDEQADHSELASWNDQIDTEPDIFTFSFPGESGSFVFDNSASPEIRLIPFKDFSITYTTVSASDKRITSFEIRTNNGYKYTFARSVRATRAIQKDIMLNTVSFLMHDYNQYNKSIYSAVEYDIEWKLTKIESPSGAYADFGYSLIDDEHLLPSSQPVRIGINISNLSYQDAYRTVTAYNIEQDIDRYWLSTISGSSGQEIEFQGSTLLGGIVINDNRRDIGNQFVKEYRFQYSTFWGYRFLKEISEISGCDHIPPYRFEYIAEGTEASSGRRHKDSKDFWGYYNGKINGPFDGTGDTDGNTIPKMYVYPSEPSTERFRLQPIPNYSGTEIVFEGSDRMPDEAFMKIGSLNKIIYPTGGGAVIRYEGNTYFDPRAGQTYPAGGLRIRSITEFDGMNNPGSITKEFNYSDPVTGESSGRLLHRPAFMMPAWKYRDPVGMNDVTLQQSYPSLASTKTIPQLWKFLMIRTEMDLADESTTGGNIVGYQFVTVTRPGAGSARFEFFVPASYGETSTGDWLATQNKFARPITCSSMGIVSQGGSYAYPFTPNPNFDHERGLLWKKWELSEGGNLVRFTENDYQYIHKSGDQPQKVWGVRYDKYANSDENIFFYGKYFLLTDYDKVLSKQTVITYDAENLSKNNTQTVEYFYENSSHHLLRSTKTTIGDGTIYTDKFKYAFDFGTIPANSEDALLRIKDLQNPANFRHGLLLEHSKLVKRPGGPEQVTGSILVKLSDFLMSGKILPKENLSLNIAAPVSDFEESSIQQDGSIYVLNFDPRYEVVSTIVDYDSYDVPLTQTGLNRIPVSTVWGYDETVPVAVINNAAKGQFAFSDFETSTTNEFELANVYHAEARTGSTGLHPYATLSKTITKAKDNYVLSFWMKSDTPVSFKLTIRNTDLTTTYYDYSFTVTPSGNGFELFRKNIPIGSAPATFVLQLVGQSLPEPSGSSATLTPSIDDVAFYPEGAEVISYTYNLPHGVSSVTSSQGVTTYKDYDKLGREVYTYDQDKNIVRKMTVDYGDPLTFSASIEGPTTAFIGESVIFKARDNGPCVTGLTYEWDFGSGFISGPMETSQTFNSLGNNWILLKVKHVSGEERTTSRAINIIPRPDPIQIAICANGALQYQCGNETYHSVSCSEFPTPPADGTVFYALVDESIPDLTFVWKKRYLDSSVWTVVGSNLNEYSISDIGRHQKSFEVRCEVSDPTGRYGDGSFRIDVFPCE